ncbi:Transposase domain protein [Candidatus Cyrtobacter comes]|uniref:Transposase domain protein n=1 Tax=Candidatus Cyrtobacter comes TaxID=675776 RepID=A0ABU5L9N1_9RICK|nr:recombinase family protein [Candidatus Cyrtobacter comes]MDZ5762827.1 Transposase domain protein [Candidatus Cyrtobacter comes]
MVLIGYARVSKSDGSQSLDLQTDALIKAGVEVNRIYSDLASGRKDDRPGLKECIKALQPGNTLVVWKLDRLGRNMKDLVNMIDTLCKKEVGFKVLEGAEIDTTTKNGRMIFGIFAALAEYERELIKERTKAGLEAARARGRKGGRPRKMDRAALRIAMVAMQNREAKPSEIAKKLNITTTTLYDYVNGDGTLKEKGVILMNSE